MNRIAISKNGAAVMRGLIARADAPPNRILLSSLESEEWRSLTFNGERHLIRLRIRAPGAGLVVDRMCAGLEDAEFDLPGALVADIAVVNAPICEPDGSMCLVIEALTVVDD